VGEHKAIRRSQSDHGTITNPSAVSICNCANGAFGEHRRHDTDGIKFDIDAAGCLSSVRRSIDLT